MKTTRLTNLLLALGALFFAFGALLNLWFYVVAGLAMALYLSWRLFAFQAAVASLHLDVQRSFNKNQVQWGGHLDVELSVSSRTRVQGLFTDVLPGGVEVTDGTNSAHLSLQAGETAVWRYTLEVLGRRPVQIERATFTFENGLFSHIVEFATVLDEATQAPYAVHTEGASGSTSTSVPALFRARRGGAGPELSHLRPFVVGDPLNRIHWKASAKLNNLMTKEFVAEMEDIAGAGGAINLILDQSGTMGRGPPGATKLDFAIKIAGLFVSSAIAKGNRLALVAYDDQNIATNLAPGSSLTHMSTVVRSLNELVPGIPERLPRRKTEVTGSDVKRIKKHFSDTEEEETDQDIRRFRHVVSYLYAHGEGYVRSLRRAPAFQAIATSAEHMQVNSTVVVVTDLENDFSSLSEGIRLATRYGKQVRVVALFSKVFEQLDDPLFAIEDIYVAYEAYKTRIRKLEQIRHVKVIEASAVDNMQLIAKEAKVA